jgi:hypothetical protein
MRRRDVPQKDVVQGKQQKCPGIRICHCTGSQKSWTAAQDCAASTIYYHESNQNGIVCLSRQLSSVNLVRPIRTFPDKFLSIFDIAPQYICLWFRFVHSRNHGMCAFTPQCLPFDWLRKFAPQVDLSLTRHPDQTIRCSNGQNNILH